jgi:hypothetical protein
MTTTGQKYRAQILLDPDQHEKLAEIAAQEGKSISLVVREAVAEYLIAQEEETERERRVKALERVRAHRQSILAERAGKPIEMDIVDLIHQIRDERDQEIANATQNRS